MPSHWRDVLAGNVAAYALMPADLRARVDDVVKVFVAEKHFEGAGGLDVDDEVAVTVAGSAALLALGRGDAVFDDIASIVVYPSAVISRRPNLAVYTSPTPISDGMAIDGQAHVGGPMVLAWDAVLDGAADPYDGRNVVVHEVAHKIDFLDGLANGTPQLPDRRARAAWRAAFEPAFRAQQTGAPALLRDYAAVNPAEFFAVACEMYVERPDLTAAFLPAVHAQLAAYFGR